MSTKVDIYIRLITLQMARRPDVAAQTKRSISVLQSLTTSEAAALELHKHPEIERLQEIAASLSISEAEAQGVFAAFCHFFNGEGMKNMTSRTRPTK